MHIFLCGFKSQFYLFSVHIYFSETRARPTTQEEVANCGCILLWRKRSWWNQTHGGERYILMTPIMMWCPLMTEKVFNIFQLSTTTTFSQSVHDSSSKWVLGNLDHSCFLWLSLTSNHELRVEQEIENLEWTLSGVILKCFDWGHMHNILKPYQLLADIRDFCHFNISHSWVIGYNMKINIRTSLVTCSVPVFALLGYIVVETKI